MNQGEIAPGTQPEQAQPTPPPLAKQGVLVPWLLVTFVLMVLFGVHFALMDPVSEAIQQVELLKQLTTQNLPPIIGESAGELLSWVISLGIETPYGPLASLLGIGLFVYIVVLRFVSSLGGALFGHLLLLVTGGTSAGWRLTFRVFAINRLWVELVTLALVLGLGYAPLDLVWKLPGLLVGLAVIRLLGMAALLAQIVRGQDIGLLRTFLVAAPLFSVFTVLSILLSLVSWLWVGLWCVAKVG